MTLMARSFCSMLWLGGHCTSDWSMICTGCHGNRCLLITVMLTVCAHCWAKDTGPTDCKDNLHLWGGTNHSGYVQMFLDGAWHDVCSQDWGEGIGAVLCTQLGFQSFAGFGNGSGEMEELGGKKYETYARCKGSEACLSYCEGHAWQRAAVNAPTPTGTALCYLTAGRVLQCSHAKMAAMMDLTDSTTTAFRAEAFHMIAGSTRQTGQRDECLNRIQTRSGSDNTGRITSPSYPLFYPGQTHCRWKIEVHRSQKVKLAVVDFYTEEGSDFLSIFEGKKSTGFSRLARLHGNLTDGGSKLIFHSHSSVVYLDFRSDEYVNERGFLIEYNATQPPDEIPKEKQRPDLTKQEIIMLSCGTLLVLFTSLSIVVWRRQKNNKVGPCGCPTLHEDSESFDDGVTKTTFVLQRTSESSDNRNQQIISSKETKMGNNEVCLQSRETNLKTTTNFTKAIHSGHRDSCKINIAMITSPDGNGACATFMDNQHGNRFCERKQDGKKEHMKSNGLLLECSGTHTLSAVEC